MREPGPGERVSVEPPLRRGPLRDVLAPNARLECLYDQATWTEGPIWWNDRLVFSDVVGRRVLAWSPDGSVRTLVDPSAFANGHAVTHDSRLIQCEHGRRAVCEVHPDGTTTVLVTHVDGRRLNSPNDVTVARDGAIWFTDPTFGLTQPAEGYPGPPDLDHTSVYRFEWSGDLRRMADLDQPNGLAFSPDERILYVSQTPPGGDAEIAAFAHDPATHALSDRRCFATVPDGVPDGLTVDDRGWLWTSSGSGVVIIDADGHHLGHIGVPDAVSNCTFDPQGTQLFMTGQKYLWRIELGGPSRSEH